MLCFNFNFKGINRQYIYFRFVASRCVRGKIKEKKRKKGKYYVTLQQSKNDYASVSASAFVFVFKEYDGP